jgi:hypothetical protein
MSFFGWSCVPRDSCILSINAGDGDGRHSLYRVLRLYLCRLDNFQVQLVDLLRRSESLRAPPVPPKPTFEILQQRPIQELLVELLCPAPWATHLIRITNVYQEQYVHNLSSCPFYLSTNDIAISTLSFYQRSSRHRTATTNLLGSNYEAYVYRNSTLAGYNLLASTGAKKQRPRSSGKISSRSCRAPPDSLYSGSSTSVLICRLYGRWRCRLCRCRVHGVRCQLQLC